MTFLQRFPERMLKIGKWVTLAVLFGAVFYLGIITGTPERMSKDSAQLREADHSQHAQPSLWTCSMHPQIRLPESGQCPICGMDLIPLAADEDDDQPRRLAMAPSDKLLAEIQTSAVERKFADARIRMVGKIDYDETRVKSISSYVPGRIDRLFVDYTGIEVKKGDHLAQIYSPQLLTAQEELIEAKRRTKNSTTERSEFLRQSDQRALESAREKLRLYGLSEIQIESIENRGTPEDHLQINAPLGGIVVHKNLKEGDYVQTGSHIYTVADLSRVWVKLDAYESDLPWIHFGQPVDIEAEAYQGEHFSGVIAFIDPVFDPIKRTVNIRVNVENPNGRLKPGMFVRGTVHSRVAKGGKVMHPGLAGKWIGPMHPEIVRDEPGPCPICGMPLLKAEDLGYVAADDETAKPLVIPASAAMKTGRRAIVYVAVPGTNRPTYEGREVILGPRAGDYYVVEMGLEEGEMVVTHGNFNIDSALQIRAKPSMLSMEGESPEEGGDIVTFLQTLAPVYEAYLNTQSHLARDEQEQAQAAFEHVRHLVEDIDATLLEGNARDEWMRTSGMLVRASTQMTVALDINAARRAFELASIAVIQLERRFGHLGDVPVTEIRCPMAFDGGASWIQRAGPTANPYFGAQMLTCGNLVEVHQPRLGREPVATSGHQH